MTERTWQPWGAAMQEALYGDRGFYHRPEGGPGHHFRTSTSATTHFARALLRLASHVDAALDFPPEFTVVEIAAARGALLTAMQDLAAAEAPQLAARLRLVAVELAARPPGLDPAIRWLGTLEDVVPRPVGLLVANEWLDNVVVDVVEQTATGAAQVEVARDGTERVGDPVSTDQQRWLDEWWPLCDEGERAEIGAARDAAWLRAVAGLERGVAVCVDYAHTLPEREAGLWSGGTLTGYRAGRQVRAVPDGSCDLTAHVAIDAVESAGILGGATDTLLTDQRSALRALGVRGSRPDVAGARSDPVGYLRGLSQAGEEAELIARDGLGDFAWLVQAVGVPLPAVLVGESEAPDSR
ncbi:MAG TPA: SAM-dependent methyltransferase [Mycobacteriales bacterium]|nr:SAM-dependent methyltransferase [Mycobacteriales bacterium]